MSENREEIERIKRDMRKQKRSEDFARALVYLAGSPENRQKAREELDAEGSTAPLAETPVPATAPGNRGVRRKSGRPPMTQRMFWGVYREARDRAGMLAVDKEIAREMGIGLQQLQRRVRKFGRPPDGTSE